MPVSIRKLTGRIGAAAEGVDPTASPDDPTLTALRDALDEHKAPYGGQTLIANAAAADRDLPRRLRTLTDSMRVFGDASHHTGVLAVAA
ncbi:hypothetical protein [Streptomyces sp. NPDC005281]|uniref:hypothetical protein n=1 Tax=Streptomyces sp. NPDC005281 TaxID=3155712 RepID=UPI0033A02610